jgi:hypothetical protein
MFIIWGRKITRRRAGYVADYCPICRAQQTFELQGVRSARHVYYVSLGSGQLLGYERKCDQCGTAFKANSAAYASVSRARLPLEELKRTTYPNLDTATKEQAALEERIRRQRLTPAERQALIKAPFIFLSAKVERRFAATHLDKESAIALGAAVGLLTVAPIIGRWLLPDSPGTLFLIVLAAGVSLVVWQLIASGARYMQREIVPVLTKSLKPLHPTQEEIEAVLAELRRVKQKIGRKLSASALVDGIQAATP